MAKIKMTKRDLEAYGVTMPNQGKVTLQKLFEMSYDNAHKTITMKLTADQKLTWATEIEDEILPPLYEGISIYKDGIPKEGEDYISPKRFCQLLNIIKHWEQLVEWMYELQLELDLLAEIGIGSL